jgi:tetratricopeptide (TPR) repeat protein
MGTPGQEPQHHPDASLDPDRLDDLWDFGDPAGSERRFRDELVTAGVGTAAAELCTQVARALGLQARYDQADRLLDEIDPAGYPPVVGVRRDLERGRLRNSCGDRPAAVPLLRAALEQALAVGEDFLAADAAHMLAIADPDRAADWTRHGLAVVAASTDPRCARWAGSLHNNLGWSRHDAGDFPGALAEFEAALAGYHTAGTPEQIRIARWSVARCLRSLGRLDEALTIQSELAAGPSDGYVDQELGELLTAMGRPEEAAVHRAAAARKLGTGGD